MLVQMRIRRELSGYAPKRIERLVGYKAMCDLG